jgi:hypothetical protein
LESLTREELINLIRKQEQQAKEMTTKMEDLQLQMALLESQQKVKLERLTAEMVNQNVEHLKYLDSAKQAEVYYFEFL